MLIDSNKYESVFCEYRPFTRIAWVRANHAGALTLECERDCNSSGRQDRWRTYGKV